VKEDWGRVKVGQMVEPQGKVGIITKIRGDLATMVYVSKKSGILEVTDESYHFHMVTTTDQDRSRKKMIRYVFRFSK
jgi:hypothetical protein